MTALFHPPRDAHDLEPDKSMNDVSPGSVSHALQQLAAEADGRSAIGAMQIHLCEELDQIVAELALKLAKERAGRPGQPGTASQPLQNVQQLMLASKKNQQDREQTRALAQHILMAALMGGMQDTSRAGDVAVGVADRYALLGALLA